MYNATVFCLTRSQSGGSCPDRSAVAIWVFTFWVSPRCSGISLLSFLGLEKGNKVNRLLHCNMKDKVSKSYQMHIKYVYMAYFNQRKLDPE